MFLNSNIGYGLSVQIAPPLYVQYTEMGVRIHVPPLPIPYTKRTNSLTYIQIYLLPLIQSRYLVDNYFTSVVSIRKKKKCYLLYAYKLKKRFI